MASEAPMSALPQDRGKFEIVADPSPGSGVRGRGCYPPPRRSGSPTPAHQPDRGGFATSTTETGALHRCRSVLNAVPSCGGSLLKAIQQPANITSAVRSVATPYPFAN